MPVDGDGIDTDALAAELERGAPAFLYVIPNFQNPSGATMSLARRKRVLELAEQHDVVVVEDDPYGLLRWAGDAPPTLYELDGGKRVMTLSSFTKTVAPGLRIGYVVAPAELAAAVGKHAENTYISPCMVSQAGLAAYCEAGYFEPGVERAKAELKARCDAMVESVRAHFPPDVRMVVPQGGYFLWLDLGPGADTPRSPRARPRPGCRSSRAPTSSPTAAARRACASRSPPCRRSASARASSASARSSPRAEPRPEVETQATGRRRTHRRRLRPAASPCFRGASAPCVVTVVARRRASTSVRKRRAARRRAASRPSA